MVARALAVRTIYSATRSIRVIVAGLSFVVVFHESQHVGRQLAQASLLLRHKFGKHIVAVCAIFENGGDPRRPMSKFLDLDGLIHNQTIRAQPASRAYR